MKVNVSETATTQPAIVPASCAFEMSFFSAACEVKVGVVKGGFVVDVVVAVGRGCWVLDNVGSGVVGDNVCVTFERSVDVDIEPDDVVLVWLRLGVNRGVREDDNVANGKS